MTMNPTFTRRWPLRLGAALTGLWYFLVYTHLTALALAHFAPQGGAVCCCSATGKGARSCCSKAGGGANACSLPDEGEGCHGPRNHTGTACLLAGGCEDELPAAPQIDALTWPHLAATTLSLQPRLSIITAHHPSNVQPYSLAPSPPDQVPKHSA